MCVLLSHGWDVRLLQEQEVSFFSQSTSSCGTSMMVSSYEVNVGHHARVPSNPTAHCDIASLTLFFFAERGKRSLKCFSPQGLNSYLRFHPL